MLLYVDALSRQMKLVYDSLRLDVLFPWIPKNLKPMAVAATVTSKGPNEMEDSVCVLTGLPFSPPPSLLHCS